MLPSDIHEICSAVLETSIRAARRVGGGDISEAWQLDTARGAFFLKLNTTVEAERMFRTEANGLQRLAEAGPLRTPQVVGVGRGAAHAWLLLEYIPPASPAGPAFWEAFGSALAELHRQPQPYFGFEENNFIGSLLQLNGRYDDFPAFFREQRLQPQYELALRQGRMNAADGRRLEELYRRLPALLPAEAPALIHGDLWSGNFLCAAGGEAVLIDPATAFAHREMDLAMAQLFGGFAPRFFEAYAAAFPLAPGWAERREVYQLYYLLVHVNLFGGSYVGAVRSILQRFL